MPNKGNWFTRATLRAAMAEQPAIMQASGWESTPEGVHMGDPSAEGPSRLRESLTQIALSSPIIDMGAELAFPFIGKGIGALYNVGSKAVGNVGRNIATTQNFIKSRQIVRNAQRGVEQARAALAEAKKVGNPEEINKWKTLLKAHQRTLDHGFSLKKGDITDLSYFYKPTKAIRVGKKVYLFEGKGVRSVADGLKHPDVFTSVDRAKEAAEYARNYTPPTSLSEQWAKDWARLPEDRSLALTYDGAVSKDAYPLMQRKAIQKARNGEAVIKMMKDGKTTYRVQRLNHFGQSPKSIKRIDEGIKMMRKELGDPNIPGRVSLFGNHYVPAFSVKKSPIIKKVDDIAETLMRDYPELFK